MCRASHMHGVPVSAKNMASLRSQLAERGGQKLRPDRLDAGTLLDVMIQQFVEVARFGEVLVEKTRVASFSAPSAAMRPASTSRHPPAPDQHAYAGLCASVLRSICTFFTLSYGRNSEKGKSVPSISKSSASFMAL